MDTAIRDQIRRAFQSVDQPGPEEVCASRGGEELEDTAAFRGKKWSEVGMEELSAHYYALFWFTEHAFHYYLPAFMVGAIEQPRATFVITLLLLLKPHKDSSKEAFRRERWGRLDRAQVEALQRWLEYLSEVGPVDAAGEIEDALHVVRMRYWWV